MRNWLILNALTSMILSGCQGPDNTGAVEVPGEDVAHGMILSERQDSDSMAGAVETPGGYLEEPCDKNRDGVIVICLSSDFVACDYPSIGETIVKIPNKGEIMFNFSVLQIHDDSDTYVKLVGGPHELQLPSFYQWLKIDPSDPRRVYWDIPRDGGVFEGILFPPNEDVDFFLSVHVTVARPGRPFGISITRKMASVAGPNVILMVPKHQLAWGTCVVDDTPPALACPAPQVLECASGGAVATFETTASDNCGPASVSCTPVSGSTFSVGQTPVACSASDPSGNTASCSFTVTVQDTQPPVPGASRSLTLWPPNHQYHSFSLADCAADPVDACSGTLPLNQYGHITRITSDEEEDDNGVGDGHTCADILLTGSTSFVLRAEREGTSDGRVYTVYYTVVDPGGNSSSSTCKVSVPHDQSGRPAIDSGPAYCLGQGCFGSSACQ